MLLLSYSRRGVTRRGHPTDITCTQLQHIYWPCYDWFPLRIVFYESTTIRWLGEDISDEVCRLSNHRKKVSMKPPAMCLIHPLYESVRSLLEDATYHIWEVILMIVYHTHLVGPTCIFWWVSYSRFDSISCLWSDLHILCHLDDRYIPRIWWLRMNRNTWLLKVYWYTPSRQMI
jgi:hypothetical protein